MTAQPNVTIQVLGCSGAIAQHDRTTSFLVNGRLLIDAGTGVGDLPLSEMAQIDHVVLSHAHLDHIAALPLMLDAVGGSRSRPLQVHALPETLQALQTHIFNNTIWPDFTRIPSPDRPFVSLHPLAVGDRLALGGFNLEVLPARHTVPAVGYAVQTPQGYWVYTGDTAHNPDLWARLNTMDLAMLVIETAFSEKERELARISQHLCPSTLAQELLQLRPVPGRPLKVGITHAKPVEKATIQAEVEALGLPEHLQLHWLASGQSHRF